MTTSKPITHTDPEIRKATIDEVAEITGWSKELLRRAARHGLLVSQGIIFVPSDINPSEGSYMVALKPVLNWFRGEATTVAQDEVAAAKEIQFVHKLSTFREMLLDEAS